LGTEARRRIRSTQPALSALTGLRPAQMLRNPNGRSSGGSGVSAADSLTHMETYTVEATRGTTCWVLQCSEYPGALSEVEYLKHATEEVREAIAFVAGVPEGSFDVRLAVTLTARTEREDGWLVIDVGGVGTTQARDMEEANNMARGLAALMLEIPEESITIRWAEEDLA